MAKILTIVAEVFAAYYW